MHARFAVLVGVLLMAPSTNASRPPIAGPNDNRTPAGTVSDSGVTLALEARRVMWHPDGDSLPGRSTEAFAEAGKAPVVPGPFLRVRAGTSVRIRVHNLDVPDTLRLLLTPSLRADTLVVPPGGTAELRVTPNNAGNYYYRAVTSDLQSRAFGMKGLLAGALVVDSATSTPRADRVLVMSWLVDSLTADGKQPNFQRMVFAINGRSWPHTERLSATVGDSIRWRVINLNSDVHPVHLHGVYFRVDEFAGSPAAMSNAGAPGRMVVTERMSAFTTMSMTWVPERAGNWLFHCHFALHLVPPRILEKGASGLFSPPSEAHGRHENHSMTGMSGLVMGISVEPRPGERATEADPPRRHLRLVAFADSGHPDTLPSLRFRLEEPRTRARTEGRLGFSPPIMLTRGEPVSITVVNTMKEATAVHWHGIELESYYDGVAGFGGSGRRISPIIAPRDSFEARFTPPRSGTFMYHSHVHEVRQHAAGLVGPLIVRDGAAPLRNDHTIFIKAPREGPGGDLPLEINGQTNPDTIVLRVSTPVRFRFVSLAAFNPNATVWLTTRTDSSYANLRDSLVVQWRPVAKDGADLPESARAPRLARQLVSMGETFDFEYTPTSRGIMRIEVRGSGPTGTLLTRVPVRVE